MMAAILRRR